VLVLNNLPAVALTTAATLPPRSVTAQGVAAQIDLESKT